MKTVKSFGRGLTDGLLRVSLFDRNPDVARALADAFHDLGGVEVLEGDLLGLESDAIVSPANSFGYMDGGIDKRIDQSFDGKAQGAVLSLITERLYGELPVGSAAVIGMATGRFPFLVVSPTMRVPGDDLGGTINAYLAMRADSSPSSTTMMVGYGGSGAWLFPGSGRASAGWPLEIRPSRCEPPTI